MGYVPRKVAKAVKVPVRSLAGLVMRVKTPPHRNRPIATSTQGHRAYKKMTSGGFAPPLQFFTKPRINIMEVIATIILTTISLVFALLTVFAYTLNKAAQKEESELND